MANENTTDRPLIEVTKGDDIDVPLEVTQGDDDAPFVFQAGDILKVSVRKDVNNPEEITWSTANAAELEFTDMANGKATLHVVTGQTAGIQAERVYLWGALRVNSGGKLLHLERNGKFIAHQKAVEYP